VGEDLAKASAAWMARAVRERDVSAVELVDACAARIEARNPEVNAVVVPRLDEAREEAKAADEALARGKPVGSLHGVPFTAKEVIPVAGLPCTNGSLLLAGRVATEDAEVIRRLRGGGAILIGKTNLAELSAFWDSVNLVYGATHNPHDPTRTAGGSSGGEAAAVALAMSPLGIGSDLSGSIRAPAGWTGIFGLRPSRDAIPFVRHDPLPSSAGVQAFGTAGPMTRTVDDVELALDVMAGPRTPALPVARVAVFEEDGLQPVSRACREAVRRAAAALGDAGIEVVEEAPPNAAAVPAVFDTIIGFEFAVALGPVFGDDSIEVMPYIEEQREDARRLAPTLERYVAAWDRIAEFDAAASEWLERNPVVLCPVAPDVAPPVGTFEFPPVDGEATRPGGKFTLCRYASALGLPSLAVPAGRSEAGLPVGVQLFVRRGQDRTLTEIARVLEEALGGWVDPDR
jgi:amidase